MFLGIKQCNNVDINIPHPYTEEFNTIISSCISYSSRLLIDNEHILLNLSWLWLLTFVSNEIIEKARLSCTSTPNYQKFKKIFCNKISEIKYILYIMYYIYTNRITTTKYHTVRFRHCVFSYGINKILFISQYTQYYNIRTFRNCWQ